LPPGSRKIVTVGQKSIGVFNIAGEYHALLNVCPHQFAPLCEGAVTGYCPPSRVGEFRFERVGEIIRCPWHAWEFDIKTGRSIFNPHAVRTGSYEAGVETFPAGVADAMVYVEV
jgi:nitrite reductase/ring-hydroxylating ferredoxin subunit